MKCDGCGADYPAKELKCPYCGLENKIGWQWQGEEAAAKDRVEKEKDDALKKAPFIIANKVLNVVMIVLIALNILAVIVVAISYKVEDVKTKRALKSADMDIVKELYEKEDFVALDAYSDQHFLHYDENDTYDKYLEAVGLYQERVELMEAWMNYTENKDNAEYMERRWDYGPTKTLLDKCSDVLNAEGYRYRYDYTANKKYLDEMQETAKLILVSEFGYDDDAIARMLEVPTYDDAFDKFVKEIYEQKGWRYGEESE